MSRPGRELRRWGEDPLELRVGRDRSGSRPDRSRDARGLRPRGIRPPRIGGALPAKVPRSSGGGGGSSAAAGTATQIGYQDLPFGIVLDETKTISIVASSTNLSNVTSSGGYLTGFDASGTGSVKGVLPHPIPVGHYRDFEMPIPESACWRFCIYESYWGCGKCGERPAWGGRVPIVPGARRWKSTRAMRGVTACAAREACAGDGCLRAAVSHAAGRGVPE